MASGGGGLVGVVVSAECRELYLKARPPRCADGVLRPRSERVKPLIEVMGENITPVGGNGDGQTCKVANLIIVALTIEVTLECIR